MKATELRIGNWYHYHIREEKDPEGKWVPVRCSCDLEDLAWLEANPDHPDYVPMPLSVGVLNHFGIMPLPLSIPNKYRRSGCKFDIYERGGKFLVGYKHGTVILDYVHELQNLYYVLEKKELEAVPVCEDTDRGEENLKNKR